MIQGSLFAREAVASRPDWKPKPLPSLRGIKRIAMDTESNGLRWFSGDKMVSFSGCLPDGTTFFAPIGHAGGNMDEGAAHRWAERELRDIQIDWFNAPYDVNVFYNWDIDLEAQGCTFSDAGHWAALLNDHRYKSNLDDISQEYLGIGKKTDPGREHMAELHAGDVEKYARHDAWLVHGIREKVWPMLDAEDLQRVRQLEDDCIPATAEMMRNGAPINEELLDQWLKQSEREYVQCLWDLRAALGFTVNPKSDMRLIFDKCGLEYPLEQCPGPDFGKVTFKIQYLNRIEHPIIRIVRRAVRLASLRSKYLIPYKKDLQRNGILRYALHQLRAGNEDEGDSGTISGRYSSSMFKKTGDGVNIQQVSGKKHGHSVKEEIDWPYQIRKLFIPEKGLWCSADADQIEYRVFSHYGQPAAVMDAYAKNPHTNFHKVTQKMIEEYIEITYERTKDCNFAGLFGAGVPKFSFMIGVDQKTGRKLHRAYHNAVPEIRMLMNQCMRLADKRGYVKTLMGRRARFPSKEKLYAALNRIVQGSAADENKLKLVALRRAKTGMKIRFSIHDEVCGDVPDAASAKKVSEVLNTPILKTRVPLLWSVNTGPNWQECKKAA